MRSSVDRGRVYRRCGCRDAQSRQRGARCPALAADAGHGTWSFAVDLPAPAGQRSTVRRGGFATIEAARAALRRLLEGEAGGFDADPNQTVADYLVSWLEAKRLVLKPTTAARYGDYCAKDLIPALGSLRLDDLGHRHIAGFVKQQLAAGRGRVTVHRCLATLSSALGDAVRQRRLLHNPAQPAVLPRPPSAERRVWTPQETVRFLRHCHTADPFMADLCEVLIGTGMRKGELLGLHWNDVHLPERVLYVRYAISAVDNTQLVITTPKTRSSKNWIALSPRVAASLQRRAAASGTRRTDPADLFSGLVFCRPDGRPLRPQWVLDRFRRLAQEAHVPRIAVHDLRHLAATLTITEGVPLTVVSKTLRHSTLSTTANIYAHLTQQAARGAVDVINAVLNDTERGSVRQDQRSWMRPHHDHTPRYRRRPALLDTRKRKGIWPTEDRPLPAYATTMRPHAEKTPKRPPPHLCGNGLRPAKTLVGTTGFEPATP